jgi:hypothetical protein
MTKEQAVKDAQAAFVRALKTGVEEDFLIDEVFDASNKWKMRNRVKRSVRPRFDRTPPKPAPKPSGSVGQQ